MHKRWREELQNEENLVLLAINAWTLEMMVYVVYENHKGHIGRTGQYWKEAFLRLVIKRFIEMTLTNDSKYRGLGGLDPIQKTISPQRHLMVLSYFGTQDFH